MDKQILDLLTEMNNEMKSMKSEMHSNMDSFKSEMNSNVDSLRSEVHNRFDAVEAKLEGVGKHFELTNESRMNEMDFIVNKVNKMEKDLYVLKNKI